MERLVGCDEGTVELEEVGHVVFGANGQQAPTTSSLFLNNMVEPRGVVICFPHEP